MSARTEDRPPVRVGQDADARHDLRARSARASAAIVLAQMLRLLLAFGSTMVLARLLLPDDFGLVAMVLAITGFVALFREFGLGLATVQSPTISEREVTTLFWINAGVGALLMAATLALAPVIARFYGDERLAGITFALAPTMLFASLGAQHRALLRRELRFDALALVDVLAYMIAVAVALVAAARGAGYWALVVLPIVSDVAALLGVWSVSRWRPGAPASFQEVRTLVAFGSRATGSDLVNYWARNSDNLLLGRIAGPYQLGIYTRAYQILTLPLELVAGPVGTVAVSALSRVAADAPGQYRATALAIVQKITLVTMPAAVLMLTGSDWLVAVLLGPGWADAAPIVAVLGIAALTQPFGHTTGWLFVTQGRVGEMLRWSVLGSAIAIASIVFGLRWGAFGVAASYAIAGALVRSPLLLWYVSRRGPIRARDYVRALAIPVTSALAGIAAGLAFRQVVGSIHPLAGLFGLGLVAVLAALLVLLVLPGGRGVLRELVSLVGLALRRARAGAAIAPDGAA